MMDEQGLASALKEISNSVKPSAAARPTLERALSKRRKSRAIVVVGGTALAIAAAVGAGAMVISPAATPEQGSQVAAGPSETDPTLQANWEWQSSIDPYKSDLVAAAMGYDNYTGDELRFSERAIIIYGTGQPPAEVAALMDDAPQGTEARWVSVPYSHDQLQQAGGQLANGLPGVVGVSYAGDDFSSIKLRLDPFPRSESDLHRLHEKATEITDIPVEFKDGSEGQPLSSR